MTTTLSVRIGKHTKSRLEAPAKRGRRSKSFPVAEAIAAIVDAEARQLDDSERALLSGCGVCHMPWRALRR
jgi:predicted transcriptional regulator